MSTALSDPCSQAEQFYRTKQYSRAIRTYESAFEANPQLKTPLNLKRCGVCYLASGNQKKASEFFQLSLADIKSEFGPAVDLGNLFTQIGELDSAIAAFSKALELQPQTPEVLKKRGDAYKQLGMFDAALTDYLRAKELAKSFDHPIDKYYGLIEGATSLKTAFGMASDPKSEAIAASVSPQSHSATTDSSASAITSSQPNQDALKLFLEAYNLYSNNKWEAAIQKFEEFFKTHPDQKENNAFAYKCLGICYHRSTRFKEAIAAFEKACAIYPQYTDARANLANSLLTFSDSNPDISDASKNREKARDNFQICLTEHPDDFTAMTKLGIYCNTQATHAVTDKEKHDLLGRAETYFKLALKIIPRSISTLIALGITYKKSNRLEEAIKIFREVLEYAPKEPTAHYNLASCYRVVGDYASAIKEYTIAKGLYTAESDKHDCDEQITQTKRLQLAEETAKTSIDAAITELKISRAPSA